VLTKDLLRVSRRGGSYRPEFIGREAQPLVAELIDTYRNNLERPRHEVETALKAIEADHEDFKLVRGLAALLDREATFETVAPLPPERTRRRVFEAAEQQGVATADERERAIKRAAEGLAVETDTVETALYADRGCNQRLTAFECRWSPEALIEQYNLSVAQTALFDATEIRLTTSDPRRLISAVKRLGLLYEISREQADGQTTRTVVITGPDGLFRRTRRYGTAFGRLLRSVATSEEWELQATVSDRGTEREMVLTQRDVSVPGVDPVVEPSYDSGVERDFASRFEALGLDWELQREPDLLETDTSVMIPDFAFEYNYGGFRVFFEVMGFWTPEYVEKKLTQLTSVEAVDLIVAVDESLGVGEKLEATDHRVIPYTKTVGLKNVIDVLREYESDLVATSSMSLPETMRPEEDVTTLEAVAAAYDVPCEAVESREFPAHERCGRHLVRPTVLSAIDKELTEGMSLADVEAVLEEFGLSDSSAVVSRLGYRVAWDGLSGGRLESR